MTQTMRNDDDAVPETVGHAIDKRILAMTTGREMSPMVRLAFDGALGTADYYHILELMPQGNPAALRKVPLEFMRYQSKDPLEEWEYLAGQRFRQDFEIAHRSGSTTVDYSRGAMFDTDMARANRAAGYEGRGYASPTSAVDVSQARIDAMSRRGSFAKHNKTSAWFLEAVIGFELWPKECATFLGEDVRYVSRRFREALHDAAGFYRIHVQASSKPRQIASCSPMPGSLARRSAEIGAGAAKTDAPLPNSQQTETPASDQMRAKEVDHVA